MWLTGLFWIAICVLRGCQPAFASKALRGLRGEGEDSALGWRPEGYKNRDEWDRRDKEAQSYRWSLAERDIEDVSYWFMEKLWWYLFGSDDVQGKTWWKLRRSFRNYLREWWLTTPWAGVATLKTGVWYALSKLTFEELPARWGGTMEYEKMKELLQDDEAIDRWTENIQRRLIWDKKGKWWKPGPWDAGDRWDWADLEKKIWWWRGDDWWDKGLGPWDKPEDRWDWGGWDKDWHRRWGPWDPSRDDTRWDWGDWEKKHWGRGDEWWLDKKGWEKPGPWDKAREDGRWDLREWKKNIRRRGDEGSWDNRYWRKLLKDDRKRGRSGWTGKGPWDHPYLDWHGGWTWDGRWEGDEGKPWRRGGWDDEGKGEWKPWRKAGWDEEATWGWKPWKKRGKEAGDKWEPKWGGAAGRGDK